MNQLIFSILACVLFLSACTKTGEIQTPEIAKGDKGKWKAISTENAPSPRTEHKTLWTERGMVVIGGRDEKALLTDGGIYDPKTDRWEAIPPHGDTRDMESAVWAAQRLVILGGWKTKHQAMIYDPATQKWTAAETSGAPSPRYLNPAYVYQDRVIFWGGHPNCSLIDGALLDPRTGEWTPMAAPPVSVTAGCENTAWNGSHLFVWGNHTEDEGSPLSGGAIYDAAKNTWDEIPTDNAPSLRSLPQLYANHNILVVWGGRRRGTDHFLRDGGIFDLATKKWTKLDASLIPPAYDARVTPLQGKSLFFWGSYSPFAYPPAFLASVLDLSTAKVSTPKPAALPTPSTNMIVQSTSQNEVLLYGGWCSKGGGFYSPQTGGWTAIPTKDAILNRSSQSEVWTGISLITWGGSDCDKAATKRNTGAIFRR